MRIVELKGPSRARMVPGLMYNRRMLESWMRSCPEVCFSCAQCNRSRETLEFLLTLESTRVFAGLSDRNFYVGCMYFLKNDFHGTAFDGELMDKTEVIYEAIHTVLEDYESIVIHVPETTPSIRAWATEFLGFEHDEDLGLVWDEEGEMKNVERLIYRG